MNSVFTTNGLGTTRSPFNDPNTDEKVSEFSMLHNQNQANRYYYQNVSLEANTTYTVSVYAAAYNINYVNSSLNANSSLRFVFRPPGGSDTFSNYMPLTGWTTYDNGNHDNGWDRYSYTFTTGAAGTYRVGWSPPYNGNNRSHYWGAQLEKGSTATRYIFTYSNNLPSYDAPTDTVTTTTVNNRILEARSVDTYTASYTITQDDVDSKFLSNTATFTGIDPDGTTVVSKTSDDGDPSNGDENPTIISLASTSTLDVFKSAIVQDVNGSQVNDLGDIIVYTIVVSNTGYTTISSLTCSDTLTDFSGTALSYNAPLSTVSATSGSTSSTLAVAGVTTFTASYTITQSDINSGGVSNTILILGSSSGLTDNVTATHEIATPLETASPVLELTKTFTTTDNNSNGQVDLGDTINYTITAENKGNVILTGLTLTDTLTDLLSNTLTLTSGPTYSSSTDGSTSQGTITMGETETYLATFVVSQAAMDAGAVFLSLIHI